MPTRTCDNCRLVVRADVFPGETWALPSGGDDVGGGRSTSLLITSGRQLVRKLNMYAFEYGNKTSQMRTRAPLFPYGSSPALCMSARAKQILQACPLVIGKISLQSKMHPPGWSPASRRYSN